MAENTEDKSTLDGDLRIRCDAAELEIFKQKAQRVTGKDYQVFLRELMSAFNDGRLIIKQTEEQRREREGLYQ